MFRELDVGTGKPDVSQRLIRPHHLFESLSVAAYAPPRSEGGEELPRATAGWYARAAREICAAIHARGRIPVLVGGSGLYLSAALRGLAPTPDVDPAVRVRLASDLAAAGAAEMHARLARLDPESARGIHAADAQRITRALEVIESTGRSIAWWRARPASSPIEGAWRTFQLIAEPDELRRRIAGRTHWMFESGLIEEARALSERGLGRSARAAAGHRLRRSAGAARRTDRPRPGRGANAAAHRSARQTTAHVVPASAALRATRHPFGVCGATRRMRSSRAFARAVDSPTRSYYVHFTYSLNHHAGIAQLVERELPKLEVAGSNPVARSMLSIAYGAPASPRNGAGARGDSEVHVRSRRRHHRPAQRRQVDVLQSRARRAPRGGPRPSRHHARPQHRARGVGGPSVPAGGYRRLPAGLERRAATRLVREQAEMAIGLADLVLFMVDAKVGRHRSRQCDRARACASAARRACWWSTRWTSPDDPVTHDFHRLGLGEPFPISSENGFAIGDLLERVFEKLPARSRTRARERRTHRDHRPSERRQVLDRERAARRVAHDRGGPARHHHGRRSTRAGRLRRASSCWSTPPASAGRRSSAMKRSTSPRCARCRPWNVPTSPVSWWTRSRASSDRRRGSTQQALEAGCSVLLIYNKWDLIEDRGAGLEAAARGTRGTLSDAARHSSASPFRR